MLSLVSSSVSYAPLVAPTPTGATRSFAPTMETAGSIKELAKKLNPVVGYWDPLGIVDAAVDNGTEEATLGWFRHAEIKDGRVRRLLRAVQRLRLPECDLGRLIRGPDGHVLRHRCGRRTRRPVGRSAHLGEDPDHR